MKQLVRLLDLIDRATRHTLVGLVGAMILIVSAEVMLRYLFNRSIGWADEMSRLVFVWSILLAIPLGVRPGFHIGIELLVNRFPDEVRRMLARVMAAGAAVVMGVVAYQAIVIAYDQWDEKMASLPLSAAWFVLAVAVGMAHTALHLLRIAIEGPPAEGKQSMLASE